MQNTTQCMEDDSIDLRELLGILKRRKKSVILVTLFTTSLALLYVFVIAKPMYEAKITLEIGKQLIKKSDGSIEVKYFDNAKSLKQALDVKYDTAGKYREKNVTAYIKSVSVPKNADHFLTIAAYGRSNFAAKNQLQKSIDYILDKHHLYQSSIVEVQRHKLQALQKQLQLTKNMQILLLRQKIERAEKVIEEKRASVQVLQKKFHQVASSDAALAAIISMQMATLQKDITDLELKILDFNGKIKQFFEVTIPKIKTQITEANASIHAPYIVPTKIVGKIYIHDKPVKPKKALIIIVALITGLMMGIFLAFFREFLSQNKEN